jgi:4-fold beta flower protein
MEDAIYAKSGTITGFHDGKIIYDLQGQPVGRLCGSQVYCMGGHYVGKLKNGVILDKSLNRGASPHIITSAVERVEIQACGTTGRKSEEIPGNNK